MASGERDQLNAAREEQWAGPEHKCAGALLRETCESCIYVATAGRVEDLNPLSNRRCRLPHLGRDCIREWIVRIEQETDQIGPRQQLTD